MDKEAELNEEQSQMLGEVYLPAFLEKCAERGYEVSSEEDLQGLLSIAANVKMFKEGTARSNIKEANAALLQATGMDVVEEQERRVEQVKTAAERFGKNGKIRDLLRNRLLQASQTGE